MTCVVYLNVNVRVLDVVRRRLEARLVQSRKRIPCVLQY